MSVIYRSPPPAHHDETDALSLPKRSVVKAMLCGLAGRCPSCGKGKLFHGYLKTVPVCEVCGEEIHHHRADDAPPYFTITIVGHIIIPALLAVELAYHPAAWVHLSLWLPLTIILSLGLLRPVKGALVSLQWALYMHGFNPYSGAEEPEIEPVPPSQNGSQGA